VAHGVSPGMTSKGGMILPPKSDSAEVVVDPKDAAETAGLRYVSNVRPGIHRKKAGKAFTYIRADGSRLTEPHVLRRIRAWQSHRPGPTSGYAHSLTVRGRGHPRR
jgi:hypothetical protein